MQLVSDMFTGLFRVPDAAGPPLTSKTCNASMLPNLPLLALLTMHRRSHGIHTR